MTNTDFDQLLKDGMSAANDKAGEPDLLLVFEARQAVMARRRPTSRLAEKVRLSLASFLPVIRVQHVGFASLLVAGCMLYLSELTGRQNSEQAYSGAQTFSGISSNTISVISSTMLTSIPTLRN